MLKKTPRFIFAFVLGLIIFLPSFFVLPQLSYAAVSLTTSSLTPTSVILNATGLTPNIQNVVFTLASTTGGTSPTPSYNNSITVPSSASGTASASFTGLSSGGSYSGSVTSSVDPLVTVNFTSQVTATGGAPTITSIYTTTGSMPGTTTGTVGDYVTITGTDLINVSWVIFKGAGNVPTTTNPSPTTITVRVPPGATSGPITVHTLNNGDATSVESFTVTGTTTTSGGIGSSNNSSSSSSVGGSGGNVEFHGLVPVCNTKVNSTTGAFDDPCDFNMVMAIINKVINYLLVYLVTPLFALILVYVGWLYLSASGSSENVTKAKKILRNAVIGFVIALAAWLIVKTILTTLGFTGPMFLS